ncbi:MAG: transketolase [Chloroflexota bacterium]
MGVNSELDELCINTIRLLSVDMVQEANSGHPGLPMGAAAMAYTLWDRFLKFNPRDPRWPDRDRFVLSAGHGSALLYSLLHLTGFDLPLEQLRRFRGWQSQTPGHPEYDLTTGVEATTGPLGQGLGNAVGMAIAEAALAARFNRPGHEVVNHYTYVLASDGDLMEGVSSEAASLAGHLGLSKLIVLYDDNQVTIDGPTSLAFTEDRAARFVAYSWHVQQVADGNDVAAVAAALQAAQGERERPSLIAVRTRIGYGSPHKQGLAAVHGAPLGEEEVRLTKENLGWPADKRFWVPPEAQEHCRKAVERGQAWQGEWRSRFADYAEAHPELAAEFSRVVGGDLPENWESSVPTFAPDQGPMPTRAAAGLAVNAIAARLPELFGGSADLSPSTETTLEPGGAFQAGNRAGKNLHFGVREHAMGAILNGIALHKGFIPFGATFLLFSDYMRPPMRLAAMNHLPVIYVFTNDSIGLGEDGPTHQPVEQLLGLRSVPGLTVIRPADANEAARAWQAALGRAEGPVALVLTRQKVPVLDLKEYPDLPLGAQVGGYILARPPAGREASLALIATGSEVHLALAARAQLAEEGIDATVVSMPSVELFVAQPDEYRRRVLPAGLPRLVVEAGLALGWRTYFGEGSATVTVEHFGASAPGATVMHEYGFNVENVCRRARELLAARQRGEPCD